MKAKQRMKADNESENKFCVFKIEAIGVAPRRRLALWVPEVYLHLLLTFAPISTEKATFWLRRIERRNKRETDENNTQHRKKNVTPYL